MAGRLARRTVGRYIATRPRTQPNKNGKGDDMAQNVAKHLLFSSTYFHRHLGIMSKSNPDVLQGTLRRLFAGKTPRLDHPLATLQEKASRQQRSDASLKAKKTALRGTPDNCLHWGGACTLFQCEYSVAGDSA